MAAAEAPKHIQLIEKRETKTSRGILSKGWYEVDGKPSPDTGFRYALELYGEDWLYKMLVFDAFIGNEDRHENNFDVIIKGSERKSPPLYDNGASLLAWAEEDELTDTKLRYEFDRSKPFRSHHAKQIRLVSKPVLSVTDGDALYQKVLAAIQSTLALLSEKRSAAIRTYLKYRLHYLLAAMG